MGFAAVLPPPRSTETVTSGGCVRCAPRSVEWLARCARSARAQTRIVLLFASGAVLRVAVCNIVYAFQAARGPPGGASVCPSDSPP
eukprot:4838479-Prymnesium_polylepis.2